LAINRRHQSNMVAVHHAARMARQRRTYIALQNANRRRRAVFTVAPTTAPPTKTTSIGLEVTKTFTSNQAEVGNGMIQYEVLEDDKLIWSGMGDDPAEGLLKVIIRMVEGDDPDDTPPEDRPDFS
jgi:hypothetical protein